MKQLLLCSLLLAFPLASPTPSHSPLASLRSRALSDQDVATIRALASRYPCAMLTLLHVMRGADTMERGSIIIDEMPSPVIVRGMLKDIQSGRAGALAIALQANLYSSASTFTELQWSTSKVDGATWRLSFDAELKLRSGRPLTPRHILEQAVEIVVSADELRLRESPRSERSMLPTATSALQAAIPISTHSPLRGLGHSAARMRSRIWPAARRPPLSTRSSDRPRAPMS